LHDSRPAWSERSRNDALQSRRAMPSGFPAVFRTTVHGIVFGHRASRLETLRAGDPLVLIPDPSDAREPAVWVHLLEGDPLGHMPPEISHWLAPFMLSGGIASATALKVGDHGVPSWKRLLIEVRCTA
jgi:hypothetical protein